MRRFLFLLISFSLVFLLPTVARAKEPATPEFTINESITRSLAQSKSVLNATKEIEKTEAMRDYRSDQLSYTPTGTPGTAAIESAWSSLLTADLNWQMSKKSLTDEEDSVVMDTCQKYWNIQVSQGAVETAKQALKQAEFDLNKAKVSQKVGLITNEALFAAEAKLASAKTALEKAQNNLETAYVAFNQIVGLWPEDRPVLTDKLTFTLMEDIDIDNIVAKAVENSPAVWLAKEKVNLQKLSESMMFFSGSYTPYQARKIDVEQAVADSVSAKEAIEIMTRNLYYSLRTLEANYPSAVQAVKLAEENLRVSELKLQAGMAVKADVAASEANLAQAKQTLLELMKNHAYYKLALDKPWAMGSGS